MLRLRQMTQTGRFCSNIRNVDADAGSEDADSDIPRAASSSYPATLLLSVVKALRFLAFAWTVGEDS